MYAAAASREPRAHARSSTSTSTSTSTSPQLREFNFLTRVLSLGYAPHTNVPYPHLLRYPSSPQPSTSRVQGNWFESHGAKFQYDLHAPSQLGRTLAHIPYPSAIVISHRNWRRFVCLDFSHPWLSAQVMWWKARASIPGSITRRSLLIYRSVCVIVARTPSVRPSGSRSAQKSHISRESSVGKTERIAQAWELC